MSAHDLAAVMEQDHQALDAFVRGDPEPKKRLYSRGDDATLANPLGPPVRGWAQIAAALEYAAAQLCDGTPHTFERISEYQTADLAYIVEIERCQTKIVGTDEAVLASLRVTTIFRHEADGWRIVHRHADPTTRPRPIGDVVQQPA